MLTKEGCSVGLESVVEEHWTHGSTTVRLQHRCRIDSQDPVKNMEPDQLRHKVEHLACRVESSPREEARRSRNTLLNGPGSQGDPHEIAGVEELTARRCRDDPGGGGCPP